MINSWGRKWGNGGFIWIPYKVFVDFVMESYEMIENFATYSDKAKFAGFARFELIKAPSARQAPLALSPEGFSKTAEALPEGDKPLVLDAAPGMKYLIVLYAKQALDLPAIMGRFESAGGTLAARLAAAVGALIVAIEHK